MATITQTIIADQASGPDCYPTIVSNGHNLDSDGSCSFNEPSDLSNNANASLGPLDDNGGSTLTHLPEDTSDALDNGPASCTSPDQRGAARPSGPACDIGAVEVAADVTQVCGSYATGALSMPNSGGACPPGSLQLALPGAFPVTLCIHSFTSALTWAPSGNCVGATRPHVVPASGPLSYCAHTYTRKLRYSANGQCNAYEQAGVIAG